MRKIIRLFIVMFIFLVFSDNVYADNTKEYAKYKKDGITITSYSKEWDKNKLKDLYEELIRNFHTKEMKYLSDIYLYEGAKYGVNAHYYDDVYIKDNKYKIGKNAYIELYNADKYNTVEKIAHTLSHEYGHHFFTYHLLNSEGIYGNLIDSKYAQIRGLTGRINSYTPEDDDYLYHWDIAEIMADDYVQLLGSKNAKNTYHYMSIDELLEKEEMPYNEQNTFNVRPQLNPYISLATEITGLYEYFFNLAGYKINPLEKPIKPTNLKVNTKTNEYGEKTYNLSFDMPKSDKIYEHTAIIYLKDNPFISYPLKTFFSNETEDIAFGTYATKDRYGNKRAIYQNFKGEYGIKIYTKGNGGYLYETNPIYLTLAG